VQERLKQSDCAKGYLFDGFPRTIPQADAMKTARVPLEHVVEIAVREDGAGPLTASAMEGLPGVRAAHAEAGRVVLTVTEPHVAVPAVLERLRAGGWALSGLSTRHASLEDVFVSLTGRHLRDE